MTAPRWTLPASTIWLARSRPAGVSTRLRTPWGSIESAGVSSKMREPDPTHHHVHRLRKARQHEAGIAAGRVPGDPARLHDRDRHAAPGKLARDSQACEPRADHADLDIEIGCQRRPHRRRDHGVDVPARGIGRLRRYGHVVYPEITVPNRGLPLP